jgi:hypothetical protein
MRMLLTPDRRPAVRVARLQGRTGACYSRCVLLPFKRDRLRERNAVDRAEDQSDSALRSPAERVEITLQLSEAVRLLSHATGAPQHASEDASLEGKARLYALPLRLLASQR